jgi:predicted helicase
LYSNINFFINEKNSDEDIKVFLGKILGRTRIEDVENYAWRVSDARKELQKEKDLEKYFTKILYRPFDVRNIFYHDSVVWRTRKEVMRHMLQENLGLTIGRQGQVVGSEYLWNLVFVADSIIDLNLFYRGGEQIFPLYLYPSSDKKDLFDEGASQTEKAPNIKPEIFDMLAKYFQKTPTPEEIFYYIYAVLYSNIYRTKYAEFLKIDFPRIPFTSNYDVFTKMALLGKRLVDLHLLKSQELNPPIAKFQGVGNSEVVKVNFVENENRVYINATQYFEGITKEIFEYQIGGYQVMSKWLKDRKGRFLTLDETITYCKIATALSKTIEIQKEIDTLYPLCEN